MKVIIFKKNKNMTVEELCNKIESGDLYGSAYLAYADEVEVKHKDREVEIKE